MTNRPPPAPETPQATLTAADVAAEFRASEREALDTAERIEKRLSLGMDFGHDGMLAAHYRKNAKYYAVRADAVLAALRASEGPREPKFNEATLRLMLRESDQNTLDRDERIAELEDELASLKAEAEGRQGTAAAQEPER